MPDLKIFKEETQNETLGLKNNITQLIQVNNSVVHYNANNIASDAVFLITDRENSNNFQTVSRNTSSISTITSFCIKCKKIEFLLLTLDIILVHSTHPLN
ncbi:unnamed protein product [Rhizophagus irregularis]|nr:unnamed protein product [Rhizophagus irregularis]